MALFAQRLDLVLRELRQLRIAAIGEQRFVSRDLAENFCISPVRLDGFFEGGAFFDECGKADLVERFRRMRELAFDLVEALGDDVEAV